MNITGLTIRQEHPEDYGQVDALVRASFATAEHCDGDEADYLKDLRKKDGFIPALTLVAALEDKRIVGQITLTKMQINTPQGARAQLLLSPLCVHPDFFRQGIARASTETALEKARQMGYGAVFLCGDPAIYRRLGFVPSYEMDIYHVKDRHAEWSMARELAPGALRGTRGTIDII